MGLLAALLAVPAVADHPGVLLVVFVVRTVVVHPVVLPEVSPGELVVFGAFVLALWRQMQVPKRVRVLLVQ